MGAGAWTVEHSKHPTVSMAQALSSQDARGHMDDNQPECQPWEDWMYLVGDFSQKHMTKQERTMCMKGVYQGVVTMMDDAEGVGREREWGPQCS